MKCFPKGIMNKVSPIKLSKKRKDKIGLKSSGNLAYPACSFSHIAKDSQHLWHAHPWLRATLEERNYPGSFPNLRPQKTSAADTHNQSAQHMAHTACSGRCRSSGCDCEDPAFHAWVQTSPLPGLSEGAQPSHLQTETAPALGSCGKPGNARGAGPAHSSTTRQGVARERAGAGHNRGGEHYHCGLPSFTVSSSSSSSLNFSFSE